MKAALYIDCNSITEEDLPIIYEEIGREDEIAMSKMFAGELGDTDAFAPLLKAARGYRIQDCMCAGSSLVSLAVEAMADAAMIPMTGIQRIYVVTGDACVIPLLDKLKLMQVAAVVIGPCSADRSLVDSAERYVYLDVLRGGTCTADILEPEEIANQIYSVSSYYNSMGRNANLEQVYGQLIRRYPDFDVRNYGYSHLSTFVEQNVKGVELVCGDGETMYLKIIDDRNDIDEFAYEYMSARGYRIDDMAELLDAIREKFPGFKMENYGYHTDYGFVLSFSKFQIDGNKGIKMKKTFKLSKTVTEEL